jgi:hypothetical protein
MIERFLNHSNEELGNLNIFDVTGRFIKDYVGT